MNDTNIEKVLFQAPKPTAPDDLLKQLQAEIALPSAKVESKRREWQNPLRRWFPALAFGVLMLSCALMIAVQASWGTNLKRENEALRTAAAELPQLREQHAALEQAQAKHDELLQLRKDNEEVHQLQAEVAKLRSIPAQIQQLQNENKRLAAAAPGTNAVVSEKFFEEAQAQAERVQCINNLKQIGLAFRIWGGDNGDKYPTSLVVMSNELTTPRILVCPSDKERQPFASLGFGQFQDNMSSYQLTVQPDDGKLSFPQCIIAKCPIHLNYLLADGSVQQINPAKPQYHEVQKDGRWYLQELQPGETFQDRIIQTIK
jgi:hypothetical protein